MSITSTTQSTLLQQLYDQLKKTSGDAAGNVDSTPAPSTDSTDATAKEEQAKVQSSFLLSLSPQAKTYLQSIGLLDESGNPATTAAATKPDTSIIS